MPGVVKRVEINSVIIYNKTGKDDKIATYERDSKGLYKATYYQGTGDAVVTKEQLRKIIDKTRAPGEILAFSNISRGEDGYLNPGHMGLYLGQGLFVSALTGALGINILSEEAYTQSRGVENIEHTMSRTYMTKL